MQDQYLYSKDYMKQNLYFNNKLCTESQYLYSKLYKCHALVETNHALSTSFQYKKLTDIIH